jgi:hypothetical protein
VTFNLQTKSLKLSQAKTNLGRLEQVFQMNFQVRTDSPATVVQVSAYLWGNLPWSLQGYGAPYAILDTYGVEAEDENARTIWEGTANYKQSDFQGQATVVEFGVNRYEEAITKAYNEQNVEVPVRNSVGDPFKEPWMEVDPRQVVKVSKCYALGSIYSPAWFAQFENSVNLNSMAIANIPVIRRGAKMLEAAPRIQVLSQVEYSWRFDMTIEIKGRGRTYDKEILDCGMYYLEDITSDLLNPGPPPPDASLPPGVQRKGDKYYRKTRAKTQDSDTGKVEAADEPILLDSNGMKLADTTPGNEKYMKFRPTLILPWEELALPRTMWEVLFRG